MNLPPARDVWIQVMSLLAIVSFGCGPSRPEPVVVAADSRIETAFRNELGGAFVLESVELRIDGRLVGRHVANADDQETEVAFPAAILPAGECEAAVHAVYRGEGHGIFSYLKDYKFDVESTHEFRAPPLGTIAITAVCFERGDPTTEISDRPRIRWLEETR